MSRERAKQREATKHIYPTSSLRDMLHGVASAWVIRKLSQENLCLRIQQRHGRNGEMQVTRMRRKEKGLNEDIVGYFQPLWAHNGEKEGR